MDHSPGQGQFRSLESFVNYYTKAHGISREEAIGFAEENNGNVKPVINALSTYALWRLSMVLK